MTQLEAWRVDVLVATFSRVSDLENMDFPRLTKHESYDADGDHLVSVAELEALRGAPTAFMHLTERLGSANLLNPYLPDREYALKLTVTDEHTVAKLLVLLSTEDGENLKNETYNGMPFDIGAQWLQDPPHVGIFCGEYTTPAPDNLESPHKEGCASLTLRSALARRLLMPGAARWMCIPPTRRSPKDVKFLISQPEVGAEKRVVWASAFHSRLGENSPISHAHLPPKLCTAVCKARGLDGLSSQRMEAGGGEWLLPAERGLPRPGEYTMQADGTIDATIYSVDVAAATAELVAKRKAEQKRWKAEQMEAGQTAEKVAADLRDKKLKKMRLAVVSGLWRHSQNESQAMDGPGDLHRAVAMALKAHRESGPGVNHPIEESTFNAVIEAVDTKLGGAALWRKIFRNKVKSLLAMKVRPFLRTLSRNT